MRRVVLSVLVGCTLLIAACSSSGGVDASRSGGSAGGSGGSGRLTGSITVYAAASLTGTFTELAGDFEKAHPGTDVRFQYGSSGDLSAQITQGAPADVFASAATSNMDTVVQAGDASDPVDFASNSAQIAVQKGNPKKIRALAGLTGVKVATCVATAPCGKLARTIFTQDKLAITPTTQGSDVKATLALVQSGEVDAGIVYVTDVKAARGAVDGVPIPAAQNNTTEYPIATVKGSKNPTLAQAWVDYVTGPDGRKVLAAAGFAAP